MLSVRGCHSPRPEQLQLRYVVLEGAYLLLCAHLSSRSANPAVEISQIEDWETQQQPMSVLACRCEWGSVKKCCILSTESGYWENKQGNARVPTTVTTAQVATDRPRRSAHDKTRQGVSTTWSVVDPKWYGQCLGKQGGTSSPIGNPTLTPMEQVQKDRQTCIFPPATCRCPVHIVMKKHAQYQHMFAF